MVNVEVNLKSIGCVRGDCTAPYYVKITKHYQPYECTVKEFIGYVLEECSHEWGNIYVKSGDSFFEYPCVEYSHGKLVTENKLKEFENRVVKGVNADGGWTRMDYILEIGDGK